MTFSEATGVADLAILLGLLAVAILAAVWYFRRQ